MAVPLAPLLRSKNAPKPNACVMVAVFNARPVSGWGRLRHAKMPVRPYYVVTGFGLPTRDSSLTRCFYWRAGKCSNLQPTDSKSGALSVELQAPCRAAAYQPIGNSPNSRASLTDRPSTSRDWVPAPLPNRPPPENGSERHAADDGAVVRLLVPMPVGSDHHYLFVVPVLVVVPVLLLCQF